MVISKPIVTLPSTCTESRATPGTVDDVFEQLLVGEGSYDLLDRQRDDAGDGDGYKCFL